MYFSKKSTLPQEIRHALLFSYRTECINSKIITFPTSAHIDAMITSKYWLNGVQNRNVFSVK